MKNIIFIAPPAAGKGTHSTKLKDMYGYVHLSTGDMLREAISSGSELGLKVKNIIDQGMLVDDETIINLVQEKLKEINGKPFILDGFPRTLPQAEKLTELIGDDYEAIYLDISRETVLDRIGGRLTCSCGASYNLNDPKFMPKVEGICDKCGSALIKREDDNAESFGIRYDNFIKNTAPLYDYYQNVGKLHVIDANRESTYVFEDIKGVIND